MARRRTGRAEPNKCCSPFRGGSSGDRTSVSLTKPKRRKAFGEAGPGEAANVPCSLADQAVSPALRAMSLTVSRLFTIFTAPDLDACHLMHHAGHCCMLHAGKAPPAIYAICFGMVTSLVARRARRIPKDSFYVLLWRLLLPYLSRGQEGRQLCQV